MEIWKPIPNHPNYEASSWGRVRSLKSNKILSAWENTSGYLQVRLDYRSKLVSHLVLEAFVGERPNRNYAAAHNDGNKGNNSVENLRWCTYKENSADQLKHGTRLMGEKCHTSKLTAIDVLAIRLRYAIGGISQRQLAREYEVDHTTIGRVVRNEIWTHV